MTEPKYDKIKASVRFNPKFYGFEWTAFPLEIDFEGLSEPPVIKSIGTKVFEEEYIIFNEKLHKSEYEYRGIWISIDALGHILCEAYTPPYEKYVTILLYDLNIEDELSMIEHVYPKDWNDFIKSIKYGK